MEFPLNRLISRFENIKESPFIFTCKKEGMLIAGKTHIPINCLYFMVNYSREFLPYSRLDKSNTAKYGDMFAFTDLINNLPTTTEDAFKYKTMILSNAKQSNTFARTMVYGTYIDNEKQLEYSAPPESPLSKLQVISGEIRRHLLLPYPFEDKDDKIVVLGNLIFFGHNVGIYVFAEVTKNNIIIRHYSSPDRETVHSINMYAELTLAGKYFCRFDIDNDGYFKLGKNTIYGYTNFGTITEHVFSLNIEPVIKTIKDNSLGFTNSALRGSRIKERKLYGFGDESSSDEDDGMFRVGMDSQAMDQWRDDYGGFL
jgi:hypothetical protein